MTAVLLSLAAFASTLAGGLFALRFRDRLHYLLAFTAGVLLGGTLVLGAAIYLGLPLALNPDVGDEMPRFMASNLFVLAHIVGMVALYWWLQR